MRSLNRGALVLACIFFLMFFLAGIPSSVLAAKASKPAKAKEAKSGYAIPGSVEAKFPKPNASFDVTKMGDMSDFDPGHWTPPKGDTIKIAYVSPFSGPGAINGQLHFAPIIFAAHDINKRGGLMVDGKRKFIEVIAADHMSKPDQCKKIAERMVLVEKVNVLMGTSGSNMMKIINEVANKYKVLAVNDGALSEELMDATNFGRYSFFVTPDTEQIGRGLAYYYGQIRKKEKKFYILCQDYSFGRGLADGFKKGLKEYYPGAQIVGEDFHKLFLTDYAPYITKIKASGAEVVYTGDWVPDAGNLLKQSRSMGLKIPFAHLFMSEPNFLHEVGVEATKGLVHIDVWDMPAPFKNYPPFIKFHETWNNLWKTKWKTAPYNSHLFEHGTGSIGLYGQAAYWLFSLMERAGSTDPEKIIKLWEGDTYRMANGKVVKMRACDHKMISDFGIAEYVPPEQQKASYTIPPYYWFKGASSNGPEWMVPAAKDLPWMDQKLDRCKGKNGWGE